MMNIRYWNINITGYFFSISTIQCISQPDFFGPPFGWSQENKDMLKKYRKIHKRRGK